MGEDIEEVIESCQKEGILWDSSELAPFKTYKFNILDEYHAASIMRRIIEVFNQPPLYTTSKGSRPVHEEKLWYAELEIPRIPSEGETEARAFLSRAANIQPTSNPNKTKFATAYFVKNYSDLARKGSHPDYEYPNIGVVLVIDTIPSGNEEHVLKLMKAFRKAYDTTRFQ